MLIIRLEYVKNATAVKITTDEEVFLVDAVDGANSGFRKGMELTSEQEEWLRGRSGLYQALIKAAGSLSAASFSKKGLIRRLREKQIPEDYARQAADYFEKRGLLDDEAYARELAKSLFEHKLYGSRRVLSELYEKGISREEAQEAVEPYRQEERERLSLLLRKKYGSADLGDAAQRRRTVAGLARYGYEFEDIYAVMQKEKGD